MRCRFCQSYQCWTRLSIEVRPLSDVQVSVICSKPLPHQEGRLAMLSPLEDHPAHQQHLAVLAQVSAHAHQQASIDSIALCIDAGNLGPGVFDHAHRLRPHSKRIESAGQIHLCMTCRVQHKVAPTITCASTTCMACLLLRLPSYMLQILGPHCSQIRISPTLLLSGWLLAAMDVRCFALRLRPQSRNEQQFPRSGSI